MKVESCDISPKLDNTVVAMVTIVVLPRNRSLNFKFRVSNVTRDIQKLCFFSLVYSELFLNFEIKISKTKIETVVALKRNCLVWLFLNSIFFHFLKHLFLLSQKACRKSPL